MVRIEQQMVRIEQQMVRIEQKNGWNWADMDEIEQKNG